MKISYIPCFNGKFLQFILDVQGWREFVNFTCGCVGGFNAHGLPVDKGKTLAENHKKPK